MKLRNILAVTVTAVVASVSAPAFAQSAGDWTFGVGVHQVEAKSDNGSLADNTLDVTVGQDTKPTITAEYFIRDNLGIEVLAALPFEHDISIRGPGKVGSTRHLPPTVSLQYHFGENKLRPFLGAGINFTRFSSEKTTGDLAGSRLDLDSSWGLAAHAGIDFQLTGRSAIRVDLRWIDIDSDVKLDGVKIGTANIDPLVYGTAYVMHF
jgi:outer membrane protein